MSVAKICLIYSRDHHKHVMIRRQLKTLLDAGYDLCVVDQGEGSAGPANAGYRRQRSTCIRMEKLTRLVWRFVRRIPSNAVHQRFWTAALGLRTMANAVVLAFVAAKERPDLYLAEDLVSAWAALLSARVWHRPVVYCAFELESDQGDADNVRRDYLRSLERRVVPQVDRLVTPNQPRADVYRTRYGTRVPPTVVRNCPPAMSTARCDVLRVTLQIDEGVRLVLYHGAMIPFRALDMLLQSVQHFDPAIALVLIGEQGDYFQEVLAPLLRRPGLRGRILALPHVPHDQIASYVSSADLGVVIYDRSNLNNYFCAPMKLYEYVMAGVPIVGCNFPEIVEFLRDYPVGYAFDPSDARSIAESINAVFRRDEGERAKTRQILEEASARFTWEREGDKLLCLLHDTIPPNALKSHEFAVR